MEPNFSKAQSEATKLLLQQDLDSLHIDIRKFTFDKNIVIDSIQNYASIVNKPISNFVCSEFSGCYVIKIPSKDINIILYDDNEELEERKHWGIVHEVGHIYLNHTNDDRIEEIEAHYFAAQIVMPEIALVYMANHIKKAINPYILCYYYNCSFEAALRRIKTLSSNVWSYTENDKKLLDNLKPLIDIQIYPNAQQPVSEIEKEAG